MTENNAGKNNAVRTAPTNKPGKRGKRVPIDIVNTQAEWFIPFEELILVGGEKLVDLFKKVKEESGELFRTLKGRAAAGKVMVHLIDWREPFGMEQFEIQWIPDDYRGGFVDVGKAAEITLWYADKYGKGLPDYLSYGVPKGYSLRVGGDCIVISQEAADQLLNLINSIPEGRRIERPKNHKIYVDNVVLTPKPEPEEEYDPPRGVLSEGRFLHYFGEMDVGEIDVFELYENINRVYIDLKGPRAKATHYEKLEPLSHLQINLVLGKMGYDTQPLRNAVIEVLKDAGYLEGDENEGYNVTKNGVSSWNMGKRHNFREKAER